MNQNWRLSQTGLRSFLIILLILGIFFRFTNLDQKVYWQDEVATSLRISGSALYQVYKQEFDGTVIGVAELQKYVGPGSRKNLLDVMKSLAGNPEHAPLYYLLARFWMQVFGYSVQVMRSLPAFVSLLSLPAIYWLCLELFESSLVGWVAIALLSISPFHVLYAQEARPYSLWMLTLLLASAALLRAMRRKTKMSWLIYTVALTAALYTQIFSGLALIGYTIYVFIRERFQFNKTLINYSLASLAALVLFAPWGFIIIYKKSIFVANIAWSNREVSRWILLKRWILGLTSVFFDPSGSVFQDVSNGVDNPLIYLIRLPVLILIGYSICFVCFHTSQRIWLFVLTLVGVTTLVIVVPSLLLRSPTAGIIRYQPLCYLGIQLAVAYLLATQIRSIDFSKRRMWQFVSAVIITSGFLSCLASWQAESWWNKADGYKNLEVARVINQSDRPLLISNDWVSNVLALSYLLKPDVQLQLVIEPAIPQVPDGFSDVFLFHSSPQLQTGLETQNYKAEPVNPDNLLWSLTKDNS